MLSTTYMHWMARNDLRCISMIQSDTCKTYFSGYKVRHVPQTELVGMLVLSEKIWLFQAAGRHQCSYLIALQKQEFLLQGGDQNWLRGLKCIPQKLRNLYDINKILAHRPWLLHTSHIEVSPLLKARWQLFWLRSMKIVAETHQVRQRLLVAGWSGACHRHSHSFPLALFVCVLLWS